MNDTLNMINAKAKAVDVIESCETLEQAISAKRYIELFNNRFDDFTSYVDLKRRLEVKKEMLNTYDTKN
jgi:hypothetical protein